jgi:hypothetical protein
MYELELNREIEKKNQEVEYEFDEDIGEEPGSDDQ